MNPNEKEKNTYPEEYLHVGEKVLEIQRKITFLEKQIESTTGVSQHNLEYNPPHLTPPGTLSTKPSTKAKTRKDLEQELILVKANGFEEIN